VKPPYDATSHYDRVTEAWTLLLGEDLHVGVFDDDGEDLATATGRLTTLMVEAAQIGEGLEVLDVGCGTGAPACLLAAEYRARVTGITPSAVGVSAARARAAAAGVADAVFEQRDGTESGFPDASFDRVWELESSHLMRRRDRLVAECGRVLRRGGRLALCDFVLRRPVPFDEVRRLRERLGLLRDVFGDARMEPLDRYEELAAANGLHVDRRLDLTAETRPTFRRWIENADRHRDALIGSIGESGWSDFVEACKVLASFWDDGTLGYGLLAAVKG